MKMMETTGKWTLSLPDPVAGVKARKTVDSYCVRFMGVTMESSPTDFAAALAVKNELLEALGLRVYESVQCRRRV